MNAPALPWRRLLAANLWFAIAYLAAGWLGLLLAIPPGYASPLSPAAGIGIAVLASAGWRLLPGLAVAAVMLGLPLSYPGAPPIGPPGVLPAVLLAAAAVIQAAVGAAIVRRHLDPAIASGRDVMRFLLMAPLVCCLRASLGLSALAWMDVLPHDAIGAAWLTWWVGDTAGVLVAAPLAWVVAGEPRALWRRRRALVAVPLVLAAGAFIGIYRQSLEWEQAQQLQAFRMKAQEVGQLTQSALAEHERFLSAMARALDTTGATVAPRGFSPAARTYLMQRPEVLAMGWLPRVPDRERDALENWASSFYRSPFTIIDVGADSVPHLAARRPVYYPALVVEPDARTLMLGRDFMSEPRRAEALGRALATGQPVATAPVRVSQGRTLAIHLLQVAAAQGKPGPPPGVLVLTVEIDRHLAQALQQAAFPELLSAFSDTTPGAAPTPMLDSIGRSWREVDYRKQLSFGGRSYLLRLAPTPAYLQANTGWQSWFVLTGGLLLTGLLGALLLVVSGERAQIKAQVRDSTARLREREARLEAILDNAADAIITVDHSGKLLSGNAAAGVLFGHAPDQLPGMGLDRLLDLPEGDVHSVLLRLARSDASERELAGVARTGARFPLSISVSEVPLAGEDMFVCVIHDLTEQRRAQEHIHRLAHHDTLTGLENRLSLTQHLEQLLAQARRNDHSVALLFLDLDHFKKINDSMGHQAGDMLLVAVAQRLRELLRDVDVIARLGGDEFIVVMEGELTPELVGAVAVRIVQSLATPYDIGGKIVHSGASVGCAMFPGDADSAETLMRHADTAMYAAKSEGRGNFQFFSQAMNAATHERVMMENRLWLALGEKQFELYLQPQVSLDTGEVVGAEALLRWHHPELGMVAPGRVIPIAEESNLIHAVGDWVLVRAIEVLAEWRRDGMETLRLAVNLSARQVQGRELLPRLDQLIARAGIDPALLELEITESTAMRDPESTRGLLRQLRERGIHVAIDDFGTGYSSLSYLKLFAIDRIKIDRGFVTDIETDANDAAIVTATVGLAHSLGLTVVAEGVETAYQSSFLRSRGCDEAQGYLFARPMPADQFRSFMQEARARPAVVP
ncbi:EAL domain-containing protein [Massilia sp. GCM10020059]|uniref:EAL domain-containing protein n=1 Tax=Massilia agrisoli TaxID=2892444 RepID=A0ABS8IU17_9BURK|nr:EAL domain-containing protein [Massilia agrisoli]